MRHSLRAEAAMLNEKIKVRVTQTDQLMEVVVFNKRADCIEVVLGEGVPMPAARLGARSSMSAAAKKCRPTSIS
jgi:hypothetical protein